MLENNTEPPWLGFVEAAKLCGVCVQTIRNHERKRAFRSRWFRELGTCGGRLIERESLLEWRNARNGWNPDQWITRDNQSKGVTVYGLVDGEVRENSENPFLKDLEITIAVPELLALAESIKRLELEIGRATDQMVMNRREPVEKGGVE